MAELVGIAISAALINNFVLIQFLGLCPFLGTSRQLAPALGMAVATGAVLVVASLLGWCLEHWLLRPLDIEFLRLLLFITLIATLVQATETLSSHFTPLLHARVGIFLPLITSNCAILGAMLLILRQPATFAQAATEAIGIAAGFALAIVVFAALREALDERRAPRAFRGAPLALITAGWLALALAGLGGIA